MRLSSLVILGQALSWMSRSVPVLADQLALKAMTAEGCYATSDPLEDHGPNEFQSSGACQKQCVLLGKAVLGLTKGTNCWCGDQIPAAASKVEDSKCNAFCVGYDKENCMWGTFPGPPSTMLTLFRRRSKNMDRFFDRNR